MKCENFRFIRALQYQMHAQTYQGFLWYNKKLLKRKFIDLRNLSSLNVRRNLSCDSQINIKFE